MNLVKIFWAGIYASFVFFSEGFVPFAFSALVIVSVVYGLILKLGVVLAVDAGIVGWFVWKKFLDPDRTFSLHPSYARDFLGDVMKDSRKRIFSEGFSFMILCSTLFLLIFATVWTILPFVGAADPDPFHPSGKPYSVPVWSCPGPSVSTLDCRVVGEKTVVPDTGGSPWISVFTFVALAIFSRLVVLFDRKDGQSGWYAIAPGGVGRMIEDPESDRGISR